ncbi:MAG: glycosyltransferase, partial [Spirochaetia bacterium]|nr:glycosyltransferase [Spirochaetia bacterium]
MAKKKIQKIRRVAVVHDWLTGMRGGEVVLEAILDIFPDADLYTLLYNRGSVSKKISGRNIYTTFIDRLPFKKKKYRHYLPLFPTAIETFDFHGYDLVVSSSHCVARGVIVPPGIPHLCFFHSPMRYVWDMFHDYFPGKGFTNRFIIPFFANYLRMWDAAASPRVDSYISNSSFVSTRIRRYYGKDSNVVFPPCIEDSHKVPRSETRGDYYLVVSAMVPYKRVDLAVEAFRGME